MRDLFEANENARTQSASQTAVANVNTKGEHATLVDSSQLTAVFLFSALLLSACDRTNQSLDWTEDVQLPDGRIVTLRRHQEFRGPHELGETPSASNYWFEFKHPDTGDTIRWQSDRDLATLALMMDGRAPVLLTTPQYGSSMVRYGCPNPPYLLFRFDEQTTWKQVPIAEIPIKRIRVNMTFSPNDADITIRSANLHLSADQTGNSMHHYRPYIINFAFMREQSFNRTNCGHIADELLER